MRLLEYVPGINLSNYSDISEDLRFQVGETLAKFDLAMAGFDHPSAHRNHRWDLANAGQHRAKIDFVDDPEKRRLLTWAFDQWTNQASPFLKGLPWQFIHGDGNPENFRVLKERVVGLLDLGDSCFNPTVCELAICLAYQMMEQNNPWAAAQPVIAGYESQRPLSQEERAVLFPIICGRLADLSVRLPSAAASMLTTPTGLSVRRRVELWRGCATLEKTSPSLMSTL
jgi:Ser/Thr protein kinase RdoA (MazF antagonist)